MPTKKLKIPAKQLRIPVLDTAELLQFFSKNKEKLDPYSLAILLKNLSYLIPNEALHQHKASILEIIQFSDEEFGAKLFDTVSIAIFFNVLSKWPSLMTEPLCKKAIDNFLPYIAERGYSFKAQSISNIFNALSKYPPLTDLTPNDPFKEAINALLNSLSNQSFGSQDILLITLAFCYFTHFRLVDFDSHQKKIIALLKELNLKELSPMAMNQLQQIFIYAPNLIKSALGNLSHLSHNDFSQYLEYTLEQPQSSLLHKEVFRYLKKCFPRKFIGKAFINEYRIGHTFVDIAYPEERVCIQVNGPDHYIRRGAEEYLNNRSQFTQFLLQKQGWTVLYIKYTDWQSKNRDEKRTYLREIIRPYLKAAEPQLNLTEQEQTMPPYSVMQQQLEIQKQLLEIQKQQLEIQKQQLAMPPYPTQPYYPAAPVYYSAIPLYQYLYPIMAPVYYSAFPYQHQYPAAPVDHLPAAQPYYPVTIPPYPTQPYYSVPANMQQNLTTQPSPETSQLGNAVNYDRHTNLFKPVTAETNVVRSQEEGLIFNTFPA